MLFIIEGILSGTLVIFPILYHLAERYPRWFVILTGIVLVALWTVYCLWLLCLQIY